MLDIDHGTYPYVTSSNTVAGQAAAGAGHRASAPSATCSASPRPTRPASVRAVPERTATTRSAETPGRTRPRVRHRHRPHAPLRLVRRRAGAPVVRGLRHQRHRADQARHPRRLRGAEDLHRLHDRRPTLSIYLPASDPRSRPGVEPIYETIEGWQESTKGARSWAQLRRRRSNTSAAIEELIEAPVALLSTSPEREDTILVTDPFAD